MTDRRRELKFVSMLITKAQQTKTKSAVILMKEQKRCSLPVGLVKELLSQGVICARGHQLAPSDAARSWLKRQQLELQKIEQSKCAPPEPKPVISENDTIIRLARKSRGEPEAFLAAHHVLVANRVSSLIAKSRLRPNITQNFAQLRQPSHSRGGTAADLSDMAIDCRRRLEQLVYQLPKDCAAVVVDVCGFEKGLQQVEFERRWPRRSAKLVLRMGLDHAAEFWNIGAFAQGQHGAQRGVHN